MGNIPFFRLLVDVERKELWSAARAFVFRLAVFVLEGVCERALKTEHDDYALFFRRA